MSKLSEEVENLRNKVAQSHLPKDLELRVLGNFDEVIRLENDISSRVYIEQILRYAEWIVSLPWNTRTQDILDLPRAHEILNKHHYGLEPVKERILEYLAILSLNKERWKNEEKGEEKLSHAILARRAPILCLVGLVGTGKTTLAKSIAEAMGRHFVRIPFGGMSDALDLRGHSRVRPEAQMGLILKGLRFAGSKNPVMLLD